MTTELRTSQVEVLKVLTYRGQVSGAVLAWEMGIGDESAAERLGRLHRSGHLERLDHPLGWPSYRLTQLGHEALEGSDG